MATPTSTLGMAQFDTGPTDGSTLFINYRTAMCGTSPTSNTGLIDAWAGQVNGSLVTLASNKPTYTVAATYISANYYEATVSGITSYTTGKPISLYLDTTSSGTVTLNINSLGTKSVQKIDINGNLANLDANELKKNKRYLFVYNGTVWVWVGATSSEQISSSGSPNRLLMTSACGVIVDSEITIKSGPKISGSYLLYNSDYLTVSSGSLTLQNVIASASFTQVTVDTKGRVISGEVVGLTVGDGASISASYVSTIQFSEGTVTNSGSGLVLVSSGAGGGADVLEVQIFS